MERYENVRSLGKGGYGQAVLVRRRTDGQLFVMKEIRLAAMSPKDRADTCREAHVLSSLRHPFVISFEESFHEGECFYIVMEYADGGDLSQLIKTRGRCAFTEDEILHVFVQLALAIKYVHDRRILHRDLKAQNIFLMADGTVKLGDFGIARVLEHTFQVCRTQIGSPFYLSPEICEGRPYNSKTDIWSLGCILYELCTLTHAFNAANVNALLMNIVRGRYSPIAPTFSKGLKDLVSRMLTKDAGARPSIGAVLATPIVRARLRGLLGEQPRGPTAPADPCGECHGPDPRITVPVVATATGDAFARQPQRARPAWAREGGRNERGRPAGARPPARPNALVPAAGPSRASAATTRATCPPSARTRPAGARTGGRRERTCRRSSGSTTTGA